MSLSHRAVASRVLRMTRNEPKNGVVELWRVRFRGAMSTACQLYEIGTRDQTGKLPTKIGWGQEVVLRANDQSRNPDLRQVRCPIKIHNSVDPTCCNRHGRKSRNGNILSFFEQADIVVDPPVRIEKNRG